MRQFVLGTFPYANLKFFNYSKDITIVRVDTLIDANTLTDNWLIPYLTIKLAKDGRDMFECLKPKLAGFTGYGESLIKTLFPGNSEMSKAQCLWGRDPLRLLTNDPNPGELSKIYHVVFFNIICTGSDNNYYFKLRYS